MLSSQPTPIQMAMRHHLPAILCSYSSSLTMTVRQCRGRGLSPEVLFSATVQVRNQAVQIIGIQFSHKTLTSTSGEVYKHCVKPFTQEDLQDGGGVRCEDHLPPHKYIKKYIYMWNNSYRTPTEHWQRTLDFPKVKKKPTYLSRAKEKRENGDKKIRMGPAPLGGSCEGGKVSTH